MSKTVINILALTLITVLLWVGFQIFKITTQGPIPAATQKELQPLDPHLNQSVIDDLKNPDKTLQ